MAVLRQQKARIKEGSMRSMINIRKKRLEGKKA